MSEEFGVDLDEVFQVIGNAEVLIVRFQIIQKRLMVDFRAKPEVPPFMAVVPQAESVEDRFRSIKRLRPEFPFPDKVMSFVWPRTQPVLVASGVWDRIVARMVSLGGDSMKELCARVMQELVAEERREVADAIRGATQYQTLWERQRA
jgi:hypothetical protein